MESIFIYYAYIQISTSDQVRYSKNCMKLVKVFLLMMHGVV